MKLELDADDLDALADSIAARLRLPPAGAEDVFTVEALAGQGLPARTVRKAIKDGELPASLVGRNYVVMRADRDAWLAKRRVRPNAKPTNGKPQSAAERAIDRARRAGTLRAIPGGS